MNNSMSRKSSVDVSNNKTIKKSDYLEDRIMLNIDDPVRDSYKEQSSIHNGKFLNIILQ